VIEYHRLLLLGRRGWAWPLLGLLLLVLGYLVGGQLLVLLVMAALLVRGLGVDAALDRLDGQGAVLPSYLALVNLSWALAIGLAWLVLLLVNRRGPGWLASVVGRFRWRWFATCLGLAFVSLLLTVLVGALLPAQGEGVEVDGGLNDFTSTTRDFLLVVVLLTPLQAAGEEYAFRGYLTQAVGRLVRPVWPSRVLAVVVPAVLFAMAHGLGQDWPVFVDRLSFGLLAGCLVILTGGLEAGIAMHVLNNFLAFGLALAFGDMTSALTPTGGSWWSLPVTLTQSLSFLVLTVFVARASALRTRAEAPELVAPEARV
jgi:membrane protease YdiL (CAAX protease family)